LRVLQSVADVVRDERAFVELVNELAELDPWQFGGFGNKCCFCGTYLRDTHYQWCIWKRAAALRWRAETRGSR
jgi:hypothetical protein